MKTADLERQTIEYHKKQTTYLYITLNKSHTFIVLIY